METVAIKILMSIAMLVAAADAQVVTQGSALAYVGWIFIGIIGLIGVFILNSILGYFKKEFNSKVTIIEEAGKFMVTAMAEFKELKENDARLERNDARLAENDAEIIRRMTRVENDIDYIKKHLKLK